MASTFLAEPLIASGASPTLRCQKSPCSSKPERSILLISSCDTFASLPSAQTMGNTSNAVFARHHVSATTATVLSLILTTPLTPRRFFTLVSSKLVSFPPNTGQDFTAAHSMPGICKSMP